MLPACQVLSCLVAHVHPALVVLLFPRTSFDFAQGLRNKAAIHVVGFCFGGHAAYLAARFSLFEQVFDFYVAGVSRMRPGGGEPSLAVLPDIQTRLACLFGTADP